MASASAGRLSERRAWSSLEFEVQSARKNLLVAVSLLIGQFLVFSVQKDFLGLGKEVKTKRGIGMAEPDDLSGLSLSPLSASSSESADSRSTLGLDPRYAHYRSLREQSRPSQDQKILNQWIESQARTRAGRLQILRGQADTKNDCLPDSGLSEVDFLIKTSDLLSPEVLVEFEAKSNMALSMIKSDDPYGKNKSTQQVYSLLISIFISIFG